MKEHGTFINSGTFDGMALAVMRKAAIIDYLVAEGIAKRKSHLQITRLGIFPTTLLG